MKFLFVKTHLAWPRTQGHDVHCYEMMRALAALGHEISLATDAAPSARAIDGLHLAHQWVLDEPSVAPNVSFSYLQERYRSYWGVARERVNALQAHVSEWRADVVVVVGLEILPYLAGARGSTRVWYAADEWVWHYFTQLRSEPKAAIQHLKAAAIKGLYERAYGSLMDRVWVVSKSEQRAMRLVAGVRNVDVLPNGVDTNFFAPIAGAVEPMSAVFWGRLGFGPNLHGLRWFCEAVWPVVRAAQPSASFTILGADPPQEVLGLDGARGIRVVPNPPDLRPHIAAKAVAVLPFVSGGGIKNKFLEAAAMAKPIVATHKAASGMRSTPPVSFADDGDAFASAILAHWKDPDAASAAGAAARAWVERDHSWRTTASEAVKLLGS